MIDKQGEDLVTDPQKALPSLLVTINGLFSDLENTIAQVHASMSLVLFVFCAVNFVLVCSFAQTFQVAFSLYVNLSCFPCANFIQIDSCAGENKSSALVFNKMTEVQLEQPQWSDSEIRDAVDIINQNIQKLDSYISVLVRLFMDLL